MSICIKIQDLNQHPNTFLEVDLDTATRTTVSYAVVDFLNLNKPQSFKSTEIRIAGTHRSNAVLRSIFRVDVIDESVTGVELNCRLEFNGIDILRGTGKLIINSIEYEADTDYHYYDSFLIGTRFNWITKLIESRVCDLDLGTFVVDDTLIKNSWDRFGVNGTVYDHNYIGCSFVPVHYGSWVDLTPGPNKSIYSEDLFPHIYVKHIINAIFDQLTDYKVSSNFFESEFFKGLLVVFTTKKGILTRALRDAATIRVLNEGNPTTITSVGAKIIKFPFFDYNYQEYKFDLWDGFRYKVKYSVKYRVEFHAVYYCGAGHTGTPDFRLFQDATPGCTVSDVSYDPSISDPIPLVPGQQRKAIIRWESCLCSSKEEFTAGIKVLFTSGTPDFTITEDSKLIITPISTTGLQCPYPTQLALYAPCVTAKVFLDALTQMFGLIWDTDENTKTIYVEPDNQYYIKGSHLDWSERVNNSRPIKQEIKDRRDLENLKFSYKMDENDFWLKVEQDEQDDKPYSKVIIINDTELEDNVKEYENVLFAPSVSIMDVDTKGSAVYAPEWIRMWKEISTTTDPSYDFIPRIGYFGGIRNYKSDQCGFLYEGVQQTGFPHLWFINGYNGSEYSLAFNSNNPIGQYDDKGLIEQYWNEYINIAKIGRVIQAEIFLTEKEVADLVFRRIIYFQHYKLGAGLYRLNTIREWDAEEGRALIELVLIST